MTDENLRAVVRIEKRVYPTDFWPASEFRSYMRRNDSSCLVAVRRKQVAGFILFAKGRGHSLHILNIATAPRYRGKGVGHLLLQHVIDELKKRGGHKITLEVRRSNRSAIDFYERHGFRSTGLMENYYIDPSEDAVTMEFVNQDA